MELRLDRGRRIAERVQAQPDALETTGFHRVGDAEQQLLKPAFVRRRRPLVAAFIDQQDGLKLPLDAHLVQGPRPRARHRPLRRKRRARQVLCVRQIHDPPIARQPHVGSEHVRLTAIPPPGREVDPLGGRRWLDRVQAPSLGRPHCAGLEDQAVVSSEQIGQRGAGVCPLGQRGSRLAPHHPRNQHGCENGPNDRPVGVLPVHPGRRGGGRRDHHQPPSPGDHASNSIFPFFRCRSTLRSSLRAPSSVGSTFRPLTSSSWASL